MSAMAHVLQEKCNNPKCAEMMMSGTGIRFVHRGMEYAFCSLPCAQERVWRMKGDTSHAKQELARARAILA